MVTYNSSKATLNALAGRMLFLSDGNFLKLRSKEHTFIRKRFSVSIVEERFNRMTLLTDLW